MFVYFYVCVFEFCVCVFLCVCVCVCICIFVCVCACEDALMSLGAVVLVPIWSLSLCPTGRSFTDSSYWR